jgi:carboxyl-terminal processing protease
MLRSACIYRVVSLLILLRFPATNVATEPQEPSAEARGYLEHALDLMQKNALNKNSIDWAEVHRQTLARARDAKTTFDTYPAIVFALTQLKEHHSFLQLPDTLGGAQRAAINAEIFKLRGSTESKASLSPFAPRKGMEGHVDRRGGGVFAHVVGPMCIPRYSEWEKNGPDFQDFAKKLHGIVLDLQAQKPEGWIIDLRGNGGGNMWPMLAGIGAVLGEGDVGRFESPNGDGERWFYKAGKAGTYAADGREDVASYVEQKPFGLPDLAWVAVLLDRGTGSSGEAIAISFAGRPRERSFGEHTAGFSTSNQLYSLPDGAGLFLCVGIELDRTGRRYPDGIDPDVKLPAPDARPPEDKDAVLEAAEDWIAAQSSASR